MKKMIFTTLVVPMCGILLASCMAGKVKPLTTENIVSQLEEFRKQTKQGAFDPYSVYDISGTNPGIHQEGGFWNYRRWYCAKDEDIQSRVHSFVRDYCDSKVGFSIQHERSLTKRSQVSWCYHGASGEPVFAVEVGKASLVSKPSGTPFCTAGNQVGILAYTREASDTPSTWMKYLAKKNSGYDPRHMVFNKNATSTSHYYADKPINMMTVIPLYESVAASPTPIKQLTTEIYHEEYERLENEFQRKAFLQEYMPVVEASIRNAVKDHEYKIIATTNVETYDFEKQHYPVGLNKNTYIKIPGSLYAVRYANWGEGVYLPISEAMAPDILKKLKKSRRVQVEVLGKPISGKELRISDAKPFAQLAPLGGYSWVYPGKITNRFRMLNLEATHLKITIPETGELLYETSWLNM